MYSTQFTHCPKIILHKFYADLVVGKHNILQVKGQEWKRLRAVFNMRFASGELINLVPGPINNILKSSKIFTRRVVDGVIFGPLEKNNKTHYQCHWKGYVVWI